jgi:hypothetical protein
LILCLLSVSGCSLLSAPEVVTLERGQTASTKTGILISYREFYDRGDRGVVAVTMNGQPTRVYKKLETGDTIPYNAGKSGTFDIKILCASNYCGQFKVTKTN